MSTPIAGDTQVPLHAALAFAVSEQAHQRYLDVLPTYWQHAARYGIPAEVAAMQAAHETGWGHYQGVVSPDAHNWCGLKITAGGSNDDPAAHAVFPDDWTGVEAHYQHLARYAGLPIPAWIAIVDPRYHLVTTGVAPNVEDLGGRWAPSMTYGNRVAARVARLRSYAREHYPESTIGATVSPAPSLIERIGQRIAAHGVAVHDIRNQLMVDGSYQAYAGDNPTHTAVHYTAVRRDPDTLAAETASWVGHARYHVQTHGWPGIAYTIGLSQSGRVFLLGAAEVWRYHVFADNPRAFPVSCDMGLGQEPTPALLTALSTVLAVLHDETPEMPNLVRERTYGHREFAEIGDSRNQTACPGALLPFVQAYRAGADAPTDPCRAFPETGFAICHGFRAYWEQFGGLAIFGYPISDEFTEDGVTTQWFERARFEHRPGSGAPFDVALGLVGAEAMAGR